MTWLDLHPYPFGKEFPRSSASEPTLGSCASLRRVSPIMGSARLDARGRMRRFQRERQTGAALACGASRVISIAFAPNLGISQRLPRQHAATVTGRLRSGDRGYRQAIGDRLPIKPGKARSDNPREPLPPLRGAAVRPGVWREAELRCDRWPSPCRAALASLPGRFSQAPAAWWVHALSVCESCDVRRTAMAMAHASRRVRDGRRRSHITIGRGQTAR
jgi:hypothetical protein